MNKYKILIEGANVLMNISGFLQKSGFFATRFVEADDPFSAEKIAMSIIEVELRDVSLNALPDPPQIRLATIDEIDTFGDAPVPGAGFTWFLEDAEAPL